MIARRTPQTHRFNLESYSAISADTPSSSGGLVRHLGGHPLHEWRATPQLRQTPHPPAEDYPVTWADTLSTGGEPLRNSDRHPIHEWMTGPPLGRIPSPWIEGYSATWADLSAGRVDRLKMRKLARDEQTLDSTGGRSTHVVLLPLRLRLLEMPHNVGMGQNDLRFALQRLEIASRKAFPLFGSFQQSLSAPVEFVHVPSVHFRGVVE